MDEPLAPMEPVLWPTPFDDGDWQFEVKWDGVRCLAYAPAGRPVRLYGRKGGEWTERFSEIGAPLEGSGLVLDGELVVLQDGRPSFHAMLRRLHRTGGPVHYMVFDCLQADGRDLRREGVERRQAELAGLPPSPWLHRIEVVLGEGRRLYETVGSSGLEGIVAKRRASRYVAGRSDLWRKVKCWRRVLCRVVGVDEAKGDIRSVRLALAQGGEFVPVGTCGNLGARAAAELRQALAAGPVDAEVAYLDWTDQGRLRHPRWLGVVSPGGRGPA